MKMIFKSFMDFPQLRFCMLVSFFLTTFVPLFALINPVSALPVFISLTSHQDAEWVNAQIKKTCLYIVLICAISYFVGSSILELFGVSLSALKIAGGAVVARSGFLLLSARHKRDVTDRVLKESVVKEDISFSPLAMPLLAGPGSMSFLINRSLESSGWFQACSIMVAIGLVTLCCYGIFRVAPRVLAWTGQAGLTSFSKMMGFLVTAIGVEMMASGMVVILKSV